MAIFGPKPWVVLGPERHHIITQLTATVFIVLNMSQLFSVSALDVLTSGQLELAFSCKYAWLPLMTQKKRYDQRGQFSAFNTASDERRCSAFKRDILLLSQSCQPSYNSQ